MSEIQIKHQPQAQKEDQPLATLFFRAHRFGLIMLLAGLATLTACAGSNTNSSQSTGPLAGNWQFTQFATDGTFLGGLQGGFLQQKNGSVNGASVYSISLPAAQVGGVPTLCNAGSAAITGTVSGQTVTLTAVAGGQTFSLTGTLTADGSTISGTYSSTAGSQVTDPSNQNNTVPCGTVETGQQWTATLVPPLTGSVQGSFHSTTTARMDQNFPVTGSLTQGPNIGATSATVTGTLTFQNYPCLPLTASVNGQISGNSVILQIIANNGLVVGQIGAQPGVSSSFPVTFTSSAGGLVVQGTNGYGLSTSTCRGGGVPGDVGNVCLAVGDSKACSQPLTLTPAFLAFPVQQMGSPATTQTVTLTNTDPSGAPLDGLTLGFTIIDVADSANPSDFNLQPSFNEQDNCASSLGSPFTLGPQQSCTISVSFSPQQSCPWLPFSSAGGAAPFQCPPFLGTTIPTPPAQTAILTATSQTSAADDSDKKFSVPISGTGRSLIVPSTPEVDFGSEALSESSVAQPLSFMNEGATPVQILPSLGSLPPPCLAAPNQITPPVPLNRPLIPGSASGLQVVTGAINFDNSTVDTTCDIDQTSQQPNFQITSDTCSGALLAPQQSCSLAIAFVPQPLTTQVPPPDYFLELNTLQCTGNNSNCEIDAGRFPVELKVNPLSPLRMSPGAGLEFGLQPTGQPSLTPLTITLFNDPSDPNTQTIDFSGMIVKGDYAETTDCGASLAPGSHCTLTVTFTPKIIGFDQGTITITYNNGQVQTVYMRGTGE